MSEDHNTEAIFQQWLAVLCTRISDANIEAEIAAVLTCGMYSSAMMG
jgi:hypothetical protein